MLMHLSYLAQLEDYDESSYVMNSNIGLHLLILSEVFVQRPATLLETKRIAKELEFTQLMVKMHQTNEKIMTTKTARHRGTKKRRSERLHQSFQLKTHKMKPCSFRGRQQQNQRQKTDSRAFGCMFAQKGARGELSRDS